MGLIIGLAMILNLLIAGFSGIVIPLVLDKFKIDPALASAVILTTITDVFGFLSFLGLATLFLIWSDLFKINNAKKKWSNRLLL